ncbi:MAG: glutamine synthetase III [Bradymonadales bacterium]|nr:glutamine synthetase III [Bradymonadales bacterium]
MPSIARFKALAAISARQPRTTIEDRRPYSRRYAEQTFSLAEAQKRLPRAVFEAFRETCRSGHPLDPAIAPMVAHGMKEWAIDEGATHFSHWFQPLTGITAEKHESFLTFEDGGVIERFDARELVQSEPDASSFPSGGLRNTFEARGYTAWDPGTPAFLVANPNGKTLSIPSVYLSYTGQTLDEKTPLLRSNEAINRAARRLLHLLGRTEVKRVVCTVGAEQEFFLVDRALFDLRPDLVTCGRTVFGAPAPKGQELEDQYFGSIKERILAMLVDAEHQLVALGIPVKTRHNEVAPAQYECAFLYEVANVAADHNQIILESLRRTAARHDLAFLSHEKPFRGINGSGKHNNWSMATDQGENLLEPGRSPSANLQFLLFLLATVSAVHHHGGMLRASVASAGNDHRLGANEAPPAIMSVFLGEDLMALLDQIETGEDTPDQRHSTIESGVSNLPAIARDTTDRNRTSPFAFTGNKFEFRAVGASASISFPNCVVNTAVAQSLDRISDRIERAMQANGLTPMQAATQVLPELITECRPALFNGDNYSAAWHEEAVRRGLALDPNTPQALRHLVSPGTRELFESYRVLSGAELESRQRVRLEDYCLRILIEARISLEMARTGVIPAGVTYLQQLAETAHQVGRAGMQAKHLRELTGAVAGALERTQEALADLEREIEQTQSQGDQQIRADWTSSRVIPVMERLRQGVDTLETLVDDDLWPYPKYRELLFCV